MSFLDLLFPKKCVNCKKVGEYICANCFASLSFDVRLMCIVCNRNTLDGLTHPACRGNYSIDGVFCGVVYGAVVRKLLYTFKYQPYVFELGTFMTNLLYEGLIQQELFVSLLSKHRPLFIPIPLSKDRYRKRGYNHAQILTRGIAKKFNGEVSDCLDRIRETKPQFGLKREERIKNVKGAFALKKNGKFDFHGREVFLIDDVLTSGSTLAEAAKVLKHAGVEKVWGVTFAREQNR